MRRASCAVLSCLLLAGGMLCGASCQPASTEPDAPAEAQPRPDETPAATPPSPERAHPTPAPWPDPAALAPDPGPTTERALAHLAAAASRAPRALSDQRAATDAWRERAHSALRELLRLDRVPAPTTAPDIRIEAEGTIGELTLRELSWSAAPGLRARGVIIAPPNADSAPGVLLIPGHGPGGPAALVRRDTAEDDAYQAGAALDLAAAGYVVLAPALRSLEGGREDWVQEHEQFIAIARLAGMEPVGLQTADLRRALDVLQQADGVDPERIVAAGTSLGGFLALTTAAIDDRIDAVVVAGFMGDLRAAMLRRSACECMALRELGTTLDLADLLALALPSDVLVVSGDTDLYFRADEAAAAVDAASSMTGAFGGSVTLASHPGGHVWHADPVGPWLAAHGMAP